MNKTIYTIIISTLFCIQTTAQIKIGSYTFKDGSEYVGELKGRNPNGKGKTTFKTGDVYEGHYKNGKEKERVLILSKMERSM